MNKQLLRVTLLITLLVAVGIFSRLIRHQMNFAPVAALSLLAAAYLPKKVSWVVPVLIMATSDAIIGFHSVMAFTWGSYVLIAILGAVVYGKTKKVWPLAIGGPGAALLFFVVTNFGVWLVSGMYSHNIAGLARCFELAVPFFRATLVSDSVFTLGLFIVSHASSVTYKKFSIASRVQRLLPTTR